MRSGRLAVGRVGCRKRGIQLVPGQKTRGIDIPVCDQHKLSENNNNKRAKIK